jgi:regulator of protease activity HflC (stomatin/prohibitin superfamily)
LIVVAVLLVGGFYQLQPNEAAVITLFGNSRAPTGAPDCVGSGLGTGGKRSPSGSGT